MIITVDRFEGSFAVVETEDRKTFDIPRELLGDAREGDMFEIKKRDNFRRKSIEKLMNEVWND